MKPSLVKHYLAHYSVSPLDGVQYLAICGHESKIRTEYTSALDPSVKGVTCAECLRKLERMGLTVKMEEG